MTRICCISDTHEMEDRIRIPPCDLILHAGDITNLGDYPYLVKFNNWAKNQSVPVVCIPGNHDKTLPKKEAQDLLSNCHLLLDSEITIQGLKIYGSPWTPWFGGEIWAFNKHRGPEIQEMWKKIPFDINILITHGPPKFILDKVPRTSAPQGCRDLSDKIKELKNLKLHVFGHLHLQGGQKYTDYRTRIQYVNAAVCTEAYQPVNPIVVVDI